MTSSRSKTEGALLFAYGTVLTGFAFWATASTPDGWQFTRELLKISLPTCDLGLALGTGILQ